LLVLVAGALAYWGSLDSPFVFDDLPTIRDNPHLRALPNFAEAIRAPAGSCSSGRPVVALSLAGNYWLAERLDGDGLDVAGYRLFNLVAHFACAFLLLSLTRRVLARIWSEGRALAVATAVALLWILHPLHTAAIDHVSYRTETLAAFFYLATLWAADRGFSAKQRLGWFTFGTLCCALAMGSKEIAVSAPLVVLLWDAAANSRGLRDALRRHGGFHLALASTWAVLAWSWSLGERGETVGLGAEGVGAWSYLLTQAGVLVHYARLVVWPDPLVLDASDWPIAASPAEVWPAVLGVLLAFGASLYAALRGRLAGVVALAVFAVLAPTSSFIPIAAAPMAEHRMVLPLAGVLVLLVLALERSTARLPSAVRVAVVLLAATGLGWRTQLRNHDYRSSLAIWQATVDDRPGSLRAREYLSRALTAAGESERAEENFRAALELEPQDAWFHFNYASFLRGAGREEEARQHFDAALVEAPGIAFQQFRAGARSLSLGRVRGGLRSMRVALEVDPDIASRRNALQPCIQLAWTCAVAEEEDLHDPAFALELATRLLGALEEPGHARAFAQRARLHDTVACAQLALGKSAESRAAAARAVEDADRSGNEALRREVREHAELYRSGRAPRAAVVPAMRGG